MATSMPQEVDWLYPDLLSKEGLIYILKQRYVKDAQESLETMEKEALVELYNRYVLPLPQRNYRNNRRGRDMTRQQNILSRKRKHSQQSQDGGDYQYSKKISSGPSTGLINHQVAVGNSSGSRLKPPPSCINFDKKVVKLSSSSPTTACEPKSQVPVKLFVTSSKKDGKGSEGIKRNAVTSPEPEISGPSPPKKKFAKISWP